MVSNEFKARVFLFIDVNDGARWCVTMVVGSLGRCSVMTVVVVY